MDAIHKCCLVEKIDARTPRVILEWLYPWYQREMDFSTFERWVQKTHSPLAWDCLEKKAASYLAWFINPQVTWTGKSLKEAWKKYRFLWTTSEIIWDDQWELGSPTPHTFKIELGLVYRFLLQRGYQPHYEASIDELWKIAQWTNLPKDRLRSMCFHSLYQSDKKTLINLLLVGEGLTPSSTLTDFSSEEYKPDHFYLTQQIENFYELSYLQKTYRPLYDSGAVICAALNFRIDLLWSKDPSADYYRLRQYGTKEFHFQDPQLDDIYHRNGRFFSLDFTFRPFYSPLYYPEGIDTLLTQYGLSNTATYEDLVSESVSETFYSGPLPHTTSKETSILCEEIAALPYGELFYYGSLDDLQPLSLNEIYSNMSIRNNFSNPLRTNENYRDTAIIRLKELLKVPPSFHPLSPSTSQLYQRTLDQIEKIISWNKDDPTLLRQIKRWTGRKEIKAFWEELTKLGFFMRGWKGGEHPWPIKSIETQSLPTEFDLLEKNVHEQLIVVKRYFDDYPALQDFPLYIYKCDKYERSSSSEEGLTIFERLNIISQSESLNSCIRISSYWLLSSAHKYMIMFGIPVSFSIREVDYIS